MNSCDVSLNEFFRNPEIAKRGIEVERQRLEITKGNGR